MLEPVLSSSRADQLEVEAVGLELADQLDPGDVLGAVVARAAAHLGRRQQPARLVRADVAHGHAGALGELVDREVGGRLDAGSLEPLAEGARALDLRAERPDAAGELAVGGHDPHAEAGAPLASSRRTISSSAALRPLRGAIATSTAPLRPASSRRAGVEHDGHGLARPPRRSARAPRSERRAAPSRSRHQPSGRDPITLEASTSQRTRARFSRGAGSLASVLEAAFWGLVGGIALLLGAAVGLAVAHPAPRDRARDGLRRRRADQRAGVRADRGGLQGGGPTRRRPGWRSARWRSSPATAVLDADGRREPQALERAGARRGGARGSCSARCSTGSRSRPRSASRCSQGGGVSVAVVVAVFLSNVPESLSAATGLRATWSRAQDPRHVDGGARSSRRSPRALGYALLGGASPEWWRRSRRSRPGRS